MGKENFFLISSVTLNELENIKVSANKTEEVRYAARKAVQFLDRNPQKYKVVVCDFHTRSDLMELELEDTPDNRMILCAQYAKDALENADLIFCSNDLLCRLIAKEYFNLETMGFPEKDDQIYKGYQKISGNTEIINDYLYNFNREDWNTNEYLVIENTDDGTTKEMRFDGEKFVALKLPPSKYIKAKNSLQRCALDALNNPDITIVAILGTYGSGKTYMCLQSALYNVQEKGRQSKILGVREVVGQGKEVGFLPGDMEEKVSPFFEPLAQTLDGGEFALEGLKQQGVLDTNIPYYMKGTTYDNTIILCDEAEDLDEKQIRLIGTRVGQNSKIYFSGDYKQSIVKAGKNNALVKMCEAFKGNKKFACVCLDEDVRSETSKMFAELFQNK